MGTDINLDILNYTDEDIEQISQEMGNGLTLVSGETNGMTTLLGSGMSFYPMGAGKSFSHYDFIEEQRKKEEHIKYLNDTCNTRQARRKRERIAKKLDRK